MVLPDEMQTENLLVFAKLMKKDVPLN